MQFIYKASCVLKDGRFLMLIFGFGGWSTNCFIKVISDE